MDLGQVVGEPEGDTVRQVVGLSEPHRLPVGWIRQLLRSEDQLDLEVIYKFIASVKFSIGANKLFNKYLDNLNSALKANYIAANSNGYVGKYPTLSPFGINGGYYYGRVTLTF